MVKKVKKKKLKIIPFIILLLLIGFFLLIGYFIYNLKVTNIFIYNNNFLNDQEIINLAKLDDYPRYYKYTKKQIEKNIEKSAFVERAKVKRQLFGTIKIYVTEYKVILYDFNNSQYILSNGKKIYTNKLKKVGYPTLINYVSDEVYDKFIKELSSLDENITNQISEIKYDPSIYDNGRFLLTMNDGNYVYINLLNFKYLNLYNDIYPNFDGHIGILYLDSGYGEASEYKILK